MQQRSRIVEARAPTRIDLGGGWTDVPPFSEEQGGFVCNIAITRYATAVVSRNPSQSDSDDTALRGGESALAHAALKRALHHEQSSGITLQLQSDFPVGAGLGGSSAAGVASLGALLSWREENFGRSEIAELSRTVEVEDLGVPGGRQDHYAAAYGGALALTFSQNKVIVDPIPLSGELREKIARRFILLYTGQSRISGETITAVLDAYKTREPSVCRALERMKELAHEMSRSLRDGDLDALGEQLAEHWLHQRALHPKITTERIDEIMNVSRRSGAIGGKAMGASGGGCVLLIARAGTEDFLRNELKQLGSEITFTVDEFGLSVTKSPAP